MAQKVQIPPDLIGGDVDEGYGKVADAFRRNLSSGREVGAAIAVYRDGRKVVDLWGGYRNGITRAPWEQDTLVNVFSTTKGIASLAVAMAASRGYLSYDAKVTDYWPEFAQAGKETVTLRQLLAHQAGLPVVDPPLTLQELADSPRRSPARSDSTCISGCRPRSTAIASRTCTPGPSHGCCCISIQCRRALCWHCSTRLP
jgi:CubicO group peptidase (beta-lactamase class C family)